MYLDVGRYQGLAETEGEMIVLPAADARAAGPAGPVVLAGPTCDGDDVIYRRTPCALPLDLRAGDVVDSSAPARTPRATPRWASTACPRSRPSWRGPITGVTDPTPASFSGRHVLAELRGVDATRLADERGLADALRAALHDGGATVLDVVSHHFDPQGTTVVALLAESHASVHAYPEAGAAFVDVFTCGSTPTPNGSWRPSPGGSAPPTSARRSSPAAPGSRRPRAPARSTSRSPRGCGGGGGSTR